MSESLQHKLDRVRPPRVQITYDVETNGAMEQKELPFVVGVMSELAGDQEEPPKPLKERKFVPIDRDNFNEVLAKVGPRLALKVPNRLSDEEGTNLSAELRFEEISDFEPQNVAKQVPALKSMLDARHKLRQILSTMEGNDSYADLLQEVLSDAEAAKSLKDELGSEESK
ncbi:hypothetical protein Pla123a_31100 [Posidoniimonas polymericola]|uniref:Type VI secretion protein n=1 Tax=Posidoniimonas polymericola TaxID=2528002 RepID=A0A5C5YL02_9BACT|nr:type VI secretion system contractile sheath small subunit [Posidoniimonas polymericola]TWT75600.1 hypothetical protein Pla123a_31100 [Posidoniimonas polymericola]